MIFFHFGERQFEAFVFGKEPAHDEVDEWSGDCTATAATFDGHYHDIFRLFVGGKGDCPCIVGLDTLVHRLGSTGFGTYVTVFDRGAPGSAPGSLAASHIPCECVPGARA